jgi:hypothetical protein
MRVQGRHAAAQPAGIRFALRELQKRGHVAAITMSAEIAAILRGDQCAIAEAQAEVREAIRVARYSDCDGEGHTCGQCEWRSDVLRGLLDALDRVALLPRDRALP